MGKNGQVLRVFQAALSTTWTRTGTGGTGHLVPCLACAGLRVLLLTHVPVKIDALVMEAF